MMAILNPVKLVIDNYPEGQVEMLDVPNNLENPELGDRKVPFGRELYICLLYTSHVRFSVLSGISAAIRRKAPIKYGWCLSFW